MATTKAEFQSLATELIDDEFAEFRRELSFTVTIAGAYDPVTETTTGGTTTTYTYQAIRTSLNLFEWQRSAIGSGGSDIQVGDFMATYTRIDDFEPTVSTNGVYDGVAVQVVDVKLDGADATVKLVLRAL